MGDLRVEDIRMIALKGRWKNVCNDIVKRGKERKFEEHFESLVTSRVMDSITKTAERGDFKCRLYLIDVRIFIEQIMVNTYDIQPFAKNYTMDIMIFDTMQKMAIEREISFKPGYRDCGFIDGRIINGMTFSW